MRLINILISLTILSSCAALKKSKVHKQMADELDSYHYTKTTKQLENNVLDFLKDNSITKSKFIILPQSYGRHLGEKQDKVIEKIEEGFTYKKKLYTTTQDIGFDLLNMDFKAIKDKLSAGPIHLVESSRQKSIIVKSDMIYEIKKLRKNKSSLRVYQLTRAIAPKTYNIDFLKLLTGKGLSFSKTNHPVDLVKSRVYQRRSKADELQIYFHLNKLSADKREDELLKQVN